ncbi:VOC family protein [Nakamurella aerolata]|uniref:VOC family protein n=1 Tax=Nakamurella aerolata TaxID=1656892 RepID=UPI001BB18B5D|nr:hypothetical protein [Nakamurella aerolata]
MDDLERVWNQLLRSGCRAYQPITDRGEGFATAAVLDPFGNLLGIMRNQHWEQLHSKRS